MTFRQFAISAIFFDVDGTLVDSHDAQRGSLGWMPVPSGVAVPFRPDRRWMSWGTS